MIDLTDAEILAQHCDAVDYLRGHPVPGYCTLLGPSGESLGYYPTERPGEAPRVMLPAPTPAEQARHAEARAAGTAASKLAGAPGTSEARRAYWAASDAAYAAAAASDPAYAAERAARRAPAE